jgi:signal transduction histidine kinase
MQISRENIIILIISLSVIFFTIGTFIALFVTLYNTKKRKHYEEKFLLKETFEKELFKSKMEVQENTLQTIGRDIHDNVGQLLSLSKLTLSSIDSQHDADKSYKKVQDATLILDKAINAVRQLASILYAENLLSEGLEKAVENELKWLSLSEKHQIDYEVKGGMIKRIDPKKELITFRIIQELLNNIIKHSMATKLTITLEYLSDALDIQIQDNGVGFNVQEKLKSSSGMGLQNLFARTKMIGSELVLQSKLDVGTLARFKVFYIE